jgi:hypothetical protein
MRTVIILSLFFVSLMLVQFSNVVPVANAMPSSTPIIVNGDARVSLGTPLWIHISGANMYILATQSATFIGSFEGNVVVRWFISQNIYTNEIQVVGIGKFTGTMNEKFGTFMFTATGSGIEIIHYNWKIIGGTRDFSTIRGEGSLDVNVGTLLGVYSGSVFFIHNKG